MPLVIYRKHELLRRLAARSRGGAVPREAYESAAEIVADVEQRGDAAVRDWTARLDGVTGSPSSRPLPAVFGPDDMARAWQSLPAGDARALSAAAQQIKLYHRLSLEGPGGPRRWWERCPGEDGSRWGREMRPVDRVGIYVPGGRNPYPSTVLMTAIPARVAGVGRITAVTPPLNDGGVHPLVLAAAHEAGVDTVIGVGGPQAIAALAFGTKTIPWCDKIVGPGNAYVAAAKKIVYGRVGIDGLMGPSELVIIADGGADPRWLAADIMAQAEHGRDSPVWLLTDSIRLAEAVRAEIQSVIGAEPAGAETEPATVAESAAETEPAAEAEPVKEAEPKGSRGERYGGLFRLGGAAAVATVEEAVELANTLAPEHLQLNVADPQSLLPLIRSAGAVYMGPWAPTALGDYAAGPSHVLPTGGTARFAGGLGVEDFLRPGSLYAGTRDSFRRLAPAALHLARLEGFSHHARSLDIRLRAGEDPAGAGSAEVPASPPESTEMSPPSSKTPGAPPPPAETPGVPPPSSAALNLNESWQPLPAEILHEIHERWRDVPFHRYPPDDQLALARRLEAEYGFPEGTVIIGSGADEILQMTAQAARNRVSRAVMLQPDFGIYRHAARLAGLPVTEVPFEPGEPTMPLRALKDSLSDSSDPVLLFLSRPNNPTGSLWSLDEMQEAADAMPAGSLLVLDEAYWEFAGVTGVRWARQRDDVAVVRTFSKALGLAGLRCGFASVPPPWRRAVEDVRMPYNVGTPALIAARAVLAHRRLMEARARETARRRDAVIHRLRRLEGLTVFPSAANFFLAAVPGGAAAAGALAEGLARCGILVRTFSYPESLAGCIRISMGSPDQMDHLTAALEDLLPAFLQKGGRGRKGGLTYG